jgi:chromosome partitioning protein
MRVVSIMNYKGGVGKTTIAANVGAGLASLGRRVLLIDLDPQTNLTFSFYSTDQWEADLAPKRTIKRWFDAQLTDRASVPRLSELRVTPEKVNDLIKSESGRLDLIPSHLGLIDIDMKLSRELYTDDQTRTRAQRLRLHRLLADALEDEEVAEYDYVLIDCAPDFGIVNRIAVVASDGLLVPAKADHLSSLGISHLVGSVNELLRYYRRLSTAVRPINPQFLGIVFTMVQVYSGKPVVSQQRVVNIVAKRTNVPIFDTTIRNAPRIAIDSARDGVPAILRTADETDVVSDLRTLTEEFVRRVESE